MNNQDRDKELNAEETPFSLDCCAEVQALLFEYMARELGESRSAFVREHVRQCSGCQVVAAEIRATLDALHAGSDTSHMPDRLSESRRRRVMWAFMHPILDWIYRHHVAVSWAMVVVVLLGTAITLLVNPFDRDEDFTVTPTVTIATRPGGVSTGAPGAVRTDGTERP
ncbi:MAG: hypothetical protein ACI856_002461 [Kiritimatiellia bacterium]|jgi:hypothetical protein